MTRIIRGVCIILAGICASCVHDPTPEGPAAGGRVKYGDLLDRVVDVGRLPYLGTLETVGRASSYDRSGGNADAGYFIRQHNGWYVIADVAGPGAIVRIWTADALRWKQGRAQAPRVRIYIDGE